MDVVIENKDGRSDWRYCRDHGAEAYSTLIEEVLANHQATGQAVW